MAIVYKTAGFDKNYNIYYCSTWTKGFLKNAFVFRKNIVSPECFEISSS